MFFSLTACTEQNKPPAKNRTYSFNAIYTTGDFSFDCSIKWKNSVAFITVNSTNARGLTISCDGKTVTFSKDSMIKKMPTDSIDKTNPALLLYEVFTALENGKSRTSLGAFDITYSEDEIKTIKLSDIVITRV